MSAIKMLKDILLQFSLISHYFLSKFAEMVACISPAKYVPNIMIGSGDCSDVPMANFWNTSVPVPIPIHNSDVVLKINVFLCITNK